MSTCIMYNRHEYSSNLLNRYFIADGEVTHSELGSVGYRRRKVFFSFLLGNDDTNAQAICCMAVGAVDAAESFLRMSRASVCEGGLPKWSIPEVRANYANVGINDDYEIFVNVFDIVDGRLFEHAFVLGNCARGPYTFDVKEDIEQYGGYGIGVDGAKMIIALDAMNAAGVKKLNPFELESFFCRWTNSLPHTGCADSVGIISCLDERQKNGCMRLDFHLGLSSFPSDQEQLASLVETADGVVSLDCEFLERPNTMVSYSSRGEVRWMDDGLSRSLVLGR